jgi:FkbM family methyltransferase
MKRIETPHGVLWAPPYSKNMITKIETSGGFELHKLRNFFLWSRIFYDVKRNQGTFLDVGANIGTTSIPAARSPLVSSVVSLEPVSSVFRCLEKGIEDSELEGKILAFNVGAGARNEKATISVNPENCGDNRIGRSPDTWGREEIRMVRLDDLIDELEMDPAFVWIDAQGWEPEILEGAPKLIERKIPWMVEFWPSGIEDPDKFLGLLEENWTQVIETRQGHREVRPVRWVRSLFTRLLIQGPGAHTDLFLIR